MNDSVVILANGRFPVHPVPLKHLNDAGRIICCDGAVVSLIEAGLTPWAIVGDMDSVPLSLQKEYASILHRSDDQESNDLTKAFRFAIERGIKRVVILGATGHREDHTLGNISLMTEYLKEADVKIITDHGVFVPAGDREIIASVPGQQVSLFTPDVSAEVVSEGLKYPLAGRRLINWWMGTLNEATGDSFSLRYSSNYSVIVFIPF
ncbi:MAG: thiamine diphosphokinase [Bacteroidales bacterium]|nr:thiamine diphosphokinase [Bacteroidales bacterium]